MEEATFKDYTLISTLRKLRNKIMAHWFKYEHSLKIKKNLWENNYTKIQSKVSLSSFIHEKCKKQKNVKLDIEYSVSKTMCSGSDLLKLGNLSDFGN